MNNYETGNPYGNGGIPETAETRPAGLTMKSAYGRSGLSALAAYGVASVVVGLLIGFAMTWELLPRMMSFVQEWMPGDAKGLYSFFRGLLNEDFVSLIVSFSSVGFGIGLAISVPLIKKITSYRTHVPIQKRRLSAGSFLLTIPVAFGLWGIGIYAGNIVSFFGIELVPDLSAGGGSLFLRILPLVYAMLGAPIIEELIFRKLLLDVLHPFGETCAALVTALLFGLMHGNSGQFHLAFLLGLLFAAVYLKTGNILYTVFLHFMINTVASLPEILGFFGLDVGDLFTYWILPALTIAGLLTILFCRNNELFRLRGPSAPDANRQMFGNPGMLIAVIGGGILLGSTDLMLIFSAFTEFNSILPAVALLSTLLTAAVIVLTCVLGGRRRTAEPYNNGNADHTEHGA